MDVSPASDPGDAGRARFTAMVVHELRGALTGALGLAELLAQSGAHFTPEQQSEMARDVVASLLHTASILDDILLVGQGPQSVERRAVDLAGALHRALDADPHAAALVAALEEAPAVLADPDLASRCLAELVANARMPTAGREQPRLRWRADGESVAVDVVDSGPVIAADEREAALSRLDRAPGGLRSRRNPGLGVQVARVAARAMGGDLLIHDDPDGGCVFRLVLPRA